MEERIIDDEIGRGIRLKKTKDGYVDVTDALAPETDEEEITVILPEEETDEKDEERAFTTFTNVEALDDEDLVDLSPEEAERVRKEKAEQQALRQKAYADACAEGERLLSEGDYSSAEKVYEDALQYDELATEASVGYWRAKTKEFTNPDALVEDYLEEDIEELESDLGYEASEIIKEKYRGVFEKRLQELEEMEAPLLKEVEEKQEIRRGVLSKRRMVTGIVFGVSVLPLIGALIATAIVGLKNFSTADNTYVMPTIVLGCVALVTFIGFLIATNQFSNACRMYGMNEKLSSTEEGRQILDIRQYKDLYEGLLYVEPEVEETEDEESEEIE